MDDSPEARTPAQSPRDASRRGLESLHDGETHPTEGDILPDHADPATGPAPGEAHRGGPLPDEKK